GRPSSSGRRRVLHVATQVGEIGGHTRNMWRWIDNDVDSAHSAVLTRQTGPVPEALLRAVGASGEAVSRVNKRPGGLLAWAAELQKHLAAADLVVLHTHNQDIVPFLALAGMRRRPQVVILNHADHVFWVGVNFVDAVVSTRRSGHALCADRRGVAAERNLTAPLCLEASPRRRDRREAKRLLGLDPDDVMLLTVARAVKFRPLGALSFADALLPVLIEEPRARLVAVGPGGSVDWSAAEALAPGRVIALPETPDTARFYEAADVYVDSFPFVSNTSLLEAGLHGIPLVSRQPFGPGCEIMGADSIGMDGVLCSARDLGQFQDFLRNFVRSADLRHKVGEATRASIEATNVGAGLRDALSRLYRQIEDLPAQEPPAAPIADSPRFDPLDLYTPFVYGSPDPPGRRRTPADRRALALETSLKIMPVKARLGAWLRLARRRAFVFRSPAQAWRYLVPEWLASRLGEARDGASTR
ncbi:MAG: glycosyl transferase family 1, partial [Alphaproteobacteria bacterium HGW-Alphaproteobacteria-8]